MGIIKATRRHPAVRFVLDHLCLPHDGGEADGYAQWASQMEKLAECENLVGVKICGIEEWGVADPQPYIKWALRCFGFGRCMAGSNWFVCETLEGSRSYMGSFVQLRAACLALNATDVEV